MLQALHIFREDKDTLKEKYNAHYDYTNTAQVHQSYLGPRERWCIGLNAHSPITPLPHCLSYSVRKRRRARVRGCWRSSSRLKNWSCFSSGQRWRPAKVQVEHTALPSLLLYNSWVVFWTPLRTITNLLTELANMLKCFDNDVCEAKDHSAVSTLKYDI